MAERSICVLAEMAEYRSKPLFSLLLLLFFPFLSLSTHLSITTDTISPAKSLSGDQTIVSKGGNFELGFFTPGKSRNYYIGIWYKKVSDRTVVWVANSNKPLSDASSSELTISRDGNLVLLAQSKAQIWSSNSTFTPSNSTIAVLLDSGNLVLKHESSSSSRVLWQSFDHPTNTWLPGAKLGYNKLTGKTQFLTSWRNPEDPSTGLFSLEIDPEGISRFYTLRNRKQRYWTTGIWDGQIFSAVPEMRSNYFFNFNYVANVNVNYFTYMIRDTSVIASFVLDYNGQMERRKWSNDSKEWVLYCTYPKDPCDVPALCGSFGVCNNYSSASCRCLQGFQPLSRREWDMGVPSSGCARKTPLQCGEKDEFLMMSSIKLPINSNHMKLGSEKECASACLSNCSCTAYSYDNGCLMWNGDLLNLKELSDDHPYGGEGSGALYLRLAASELPSSRPEKGRSWTTGRKVALAITVFSAALGLILAVIWRLNRGKTEQVEGFLVSYRYEVLRKATKDFSHKIGRGGFGSVFKGVLPNSSPIAVKKLEGLRQGEKQFRMEVSTIGVVHHANLVRLLGFCSEGANRLLVYDYIPNGSLDSHLFHDTSNTLDWTQRYQIAVGVARGLAYLHEKCRECIMHCDIKPENILLDEEMSPKLADFGMAKLMGRELSRVLTTMRGTVGYLAPEWILGTPITTKADVYSFGLMLLEMISGRRNTEVLEEASVYFPVWVAIKLHEGDDVLCLLDRRLEGNADMGELNRACRIACWCIQDEESCRPPMGLVVQMLEGALEVSTPPVPRLLSNLTSKHGFAAVDQYYHSMARTKSTKYYSCDSQYEGDA